MYIPKTAAINYIVIYFYAIYTTIFQLFDTSTPGYYRLKYSAYLYTVYIRKDQGILQILFVNV